MCDRRYDKRQSSKGAQCGNKVAYSTYTIARHAWRSIKHDRKRSRYYGWNGKDVMSPYRCRYCHFWHLGH